MTEPELAAVSGSGESRGFEGREEPSPDSCSSCHVSSCSSAALGGGKALLRSGQPIDVRWTVDTDNRNRVGTHESGAWQMGFSLEIHNNDYIASFSVMLEYVILVES